jgi:hypothetical protein
MPPSVVIPTEDEWATFDTMVKVLSHMRQAQHLLEGDKYVTTGWAYFLLEVYIHPSLVAEANAGSNTKMLE